MGKQVLLWASWLHLRPLLLLGGSNCYQEQHSLIKNRRLPVTYLKNNKFDHNKQRCTKTAALPHRHDNMHAMQLDIYCSDRKVRFPSA